MPKSFKATKWCLINHSRPRSVAGFIYLFIYKLLIVIMSHIYTCFYLILDGIIKIIRQQKSKYRKWHKLN